MGMQPGILLMACLLSLYLVAMLGFWDCLRGHKSAEPLGTEGRLTLRAGQTILGVRDTTEMMCVCLGTSEDPVHQEKDTRR
jgi:hypothetical protein